MTFHDKYNLKDIINASGHMTKLGVSQVSESVIVAQKYGGKNFFEMDDLLYKTGKFIANLLNVEDAHIVSSASAGIVQSISAIICEDNMYFVYNPYDNTIERKEIIVPKGQNVDYGTPIELMVSQGGGEMVEAGFANGCSKEHVELMISKKTAGIFYVKSHHSVQKNMLTVSEAAEVANKHNLPLIVDAAAEENLQLYLKKGADIVIYSGAKAIKGPTSGLVIGKKNIINNIRIQSKGIGRAMKIGKENILGFTQAVEDYVTKGTETGCSMKNRLIPFIENLNTINNIEATIIQDNAGRDIYRGEVKVYGEITAQMITSELRNHNPAIYTRDYRVNEGIIEFDVRSVNEEQLQIIISRIKKIMNNKDVI